MISETTMKSTIPPNNSTRSGNRRIGESSASRANDSRQPSRASELSHLTGNSIFAAVAVVATKQSLAVMFVAAALVWVGFVAAKLVFPDWQFMRLSVPLLLDVWPQTAFYSIQSDVLSPLCFGVAFVFVSNCCGAMKNSGVPYKEK